MFVDDTVMFSSSWERLQQKLDSAKNYLGISLQPWGLFLLLKNELYTQKGLKAYYKPQVTDVINILVIKK